MGTTALLVIDVQNGLVEEFGDEAWNGVLANIATLVVRARSAGVPVIYVQHEEDEGSLVPGTEGWQIHPVVAPQGELTVQKRTADSFGGTPLAGELAVRGVSHLVVVGAQTECCVDATVRRAAALGHTVTLVSDAHATVDNGVLTRQQIIAHHNATLGNIPLGSEVAVKPTAQVAF